MDRSGKDLFLLATVPATVIILVIACTAATRFQQPEEAVADLAHIVFRFVLRYFVQDRTDRLVHFLTVLELVRAALQHRFDVRQQLTVDRGKLALQHGRTGGGRHLLARDAR
uniref:Putative secreted peptide n=1 Tax=Anopheles braziliensis TaxID=58242 RepID=A0A2M3ZNT9_9DIPT